MSVYHPPVEEHENVVKAALRVIGSTHYQRADDPHADAEQEYAEEQLALAARALAQAVDRKDPDERPIGWSKGVEEEPRTVVICGSTRFMNEMAEADLRETAAGNIVVKPGCNMKEPHPLWADPLEAERLKGRLDQLHRAKIRMSDEVLVVGDYIGSSTTAEVRYARALGKPVRFTHPEVDPERAV
jgi:hypothetical protein